MNNADKEYFRLVNKILNEGSWETNRTGERAMTTAGFMFEHDMAEGFPLLTSRKLPFKSTKVELEFFIKGLNNKKWLQERGCKYWDGWANPQKVPYGNDEETKRKMREEEDLGLIYGVQWRNFSDPLHPENGIDQLKKIVDTLKTNPQDRRMVCTAWNPLALPHAALPSCHDGFRICVIGNKLNLAWTQRSVDTYLGFPANLSSYALLLHLLAKESNLEEGKIIGFLWNIHLYENQITAAKELLNRETYQLPSIKTEKFSSIFDWEYSDTELIDYKSSPVLSVDVVI
jgi:thymidylate synthase